jgi:hypothetical protein
MDYRQPVLQLPEPQQMERCLQANLLEASIQPSDRQMLRKEIHRQNLQKETGSKVPIKFSVLYRMETIDKSAHYYLLINFQWLYLQQYNYFFAKKLGVNALTKFRNYYFFD